MFPESSLSAPIGQPFIILPIVDSTNNYAMGLVHEGMASHGTAVFAQYQAAGKGQRGKQWDSEEGMNLILSIILQTPPSAKPFQLSALIALACRDLVLREVKSEVSVKWPNDIYWRDRKAAGILIENKFQGPEWKWCIAGIGMNLNQVSFDPSLKNPVSLKQVTGRDFDCLQMARDLCEMISFRYQKFDPAILLSEYNECLYKKNEMVTLQHDGQTLQTIIRGVNEKGELLTSDITERTFDQAVWLG